MSSQNKTVSTCPAESAPAVNTNKILIGIINIHIKKLSVAFEPFHFIERGVHI